MYMHIHTLAMKFDTNHKDMLVTSYALIHNIYIGELIQICVFMQKKNCLAVLSLLLGFTITDPLLLQCQFKCLQSGLINFLQLDEQVFNDYVKKVSKSLGYYFFF